MRIQITRRDVTLLEFIFMFKAVSFKQITNSIFKRNISTVSKRLVKLRKSGLITVVAKSSELNSSLVFGLTKNGFNQLIKFYPNLCFIERYKSNSIFHDVTLVDVANTLKERSNVESYWPENLIQSSKLFVEDDSLSFFRDFYFDGLIKYKTESSGSFIFGVEFENSQKSAESYKSKIYQIYQNARPQAVLYVCKDNRIEKAIKKAESEIASNRPKKLYFIQLNELTKGEKNLTFENQDSKKIVIK